MSARLKTFNAAAILITHQAVSHASRVAVLTERIRVLFEDELPCASGNPWFEETRRQWRKAEAELAALTESDLAQNNARREYEAATEKGVG